MGIVLSLCNWTDHHSLLKNGREIGVVTKVPPSATEPDIANVNSPYWWLFGRAEPEYDPDCEPE